jgi:error-prone DNA polymerase
MTGFVDLCVTSNFSFLRAAAHPEELVEYAKELGHVGIGIADRNSLAGIVRAHAAAKEQELKLAVGARLVFQDATPDIFVYPKDRPAYSRLTRLLTIGNRRAPKGQCWLNFEDFLSHAEGLQAILIPDLAVGSSPDIGIKNCLETIIKTCGKVWLSARFIFDGEDRRRIRLLKKIARETGAKLIATTEPLHHTPDRRALLDVITCIREHTTLDAAGRLLAPNAERHLKPPQEMQRLYASVPEAVTETIRFLDGLTFSLDELSYQYPDETVEGYATPQAALEALSWAGAAKRYPDGIPQSVTASLERELSIVAHLNYAPYFLTVEDIVRFARDERGISCQGRGSAANSTICYALGVTAVNPATSTLLFDRFISTERNEPPDIDIDFEHERREEVIQYVYNKYGRHRAALAATLICYRKRSAIRDVCKTFGYSEDRIASLSKMQQWWSKGTSEKDLAALGLDISDRRLMTCLKLVAELRNFPRHLSQHVGGLIITRERLDDVVPIQNAAMEDRTVVEWDKNDLQQLKILKVDMLALGMLTCLRKAFTMIEETYPQWDGKGGKLTLDSMPKEDASVYRMLHRADSVGVFQVESRAQMTMLPRLRPMRFYDLVIEVAIVRPGPIQGGMVHPYLKRRQGLEQVTYPSKALEAVLERTLGVPLFQEQAMQIAIVGAGFSPAEADKLRRAMATFRRVGTISKLREKFINGMIKNGYEPTFAEASFKQIEGFGEYGFPESHAASFALLVYASCWLKCHYPDVFAVALLNSQPMGFYAPSEIVRDAREHGVEVGAPDVNASDWDNKLEFTRIAADHVHPRHNDMRQDIFSTRTARLGFRQISGLRHDELNRLVTNRGKGYDSVRDVWLRGDVSVSTIERLADADAFRSLGLDRRDALWAARGLNRVGGQEDLPLFSIANDRNHEIDFGLPSMIMGEHVVEDYRTIGLSLKSHPAALLRTELTARGMIPTDQLGTFKNGRKVRVAGLVLVRQRPGTASGVIFMTLQDEGHVANVVVWPKVFEQYRAEVLGARFCAVEGYVQCESGVIHVIAQKLSNFTPLLAKLSASPFIPTITNADEVKRPVEMDTRTHPRNVRHKLSVEPVAKVMPKGRNFH